MFGREAERAGIEQLLDSVGEGPVGLALEGVPGIGKTTLWRDALDSARQRDYRVLVTAPGEPDSTLAFAGLGDLLEGDLDIAEAGLPDPQRNALAAALSLDGGSEADRPIRWRYRVRSVRFCGGSRRMARWWWRSTMSSGSTVRPHACWRLRFAASVMIQFACC